MFQLYVVGIRTNNLWDGSPVRYSGGIFATVAVFATQSFYQHQAFRVALKINFNFGVTQHTILKDLQVKCDLKLQFYFCLNKTTELHCVFRFSIIL